MQITDLLTMTCKYPSLSTEQRLKAFDELQQQYPDAVQQESKMGLYEQALHLLNQNSSNPAETERLKQALQERLTKQEKVDMQLKEQREGQQQQKVDQYQQALKQLQQDMEPLKTQLSNTEWQQQYETRLENLRLKMFQLSRHPATWVATISPYSFFPYANI